MSVNSESLQVVSTRWSAAEPERRLPVENPATGEPFAVVHGSGPGEVAAAVRAAHAAFGEWRQRTPRERGQLLVKASAAIRAHARELAEIECREVGKPFGQALGGDLEMCAASFEYFGAAVDKLAGEFYDHGPAASVVLREPYGVVAGIIPFNWPPVHTASKAAPALAMGNTVVLKPPEQAPMTVIRIAEILQEVLPADVIHVVPGGPEVGSALVSDPLVRRVSFTGSSATAVHVLNGVAANLTPTVLELGGKNPIVIFDDADLDAALLGIIEAGFFNNGQACTSVERVIVQRSVLGEVEARLAEAVRRLRVGDPSDAGTHVGPLIDARQRDRVLGCLQTAEKEGARIAAQAPLPQAPELRAGYFVAPTLLTGVTADMTVAREEIFGPVTCTIAFDTYQEAIEIANDTPYGLMASVYTADQARGMRAAREIEAGIVFINNYWRALLGTPFGGMKASGHGREHALETLRDYSQSKNIRIPTGCGEFPYWPGATDVLT